MSAFALLSKPEIAGDLDQRVIDDALKYIDECKVTQGAETSEECATLSEVFQATGNVLGESCTIQGGPSPPSRCCKSSEKRTD